PVPDPEIEDELLNDILELPPLDLSAQPDHYIDDDDVDWQSDVGYSKALDTANLQQQRLEDKLDEPELWMSDYSASDSESTISEDDNANLPAQDASDWFPYDSKATFLLDLIDNIPCQKISTAMMRIIVWLLKKCDVPNVPSVNRLRRIQQDLRKYSIRSTPTQIDDQTLYMNNPCDLISQGWATQRIREHIRLYLEISSSDGLISEIWHGTKWRKDINAPMWDGIENGKHYYIRELC
ncbi:hypothetical protein ACJ73_10239, partial [Blastomyces percursus]